METYPQLINYDSDVYDYFKEQSVLLVCLNLVTQFDVIRLDTTFVVTT